MQLHNTVDNSSVSEILLKAGAPNRTQVNHVTGIPKMAHFRNCVIIDVVLSNTKNICFPVSHDFAFLSFID